MRFLLVFVLLLLCLGTPLSAGEEVKPRYTRFPETISPDGAYCLAWDHKLVEGADAGMLVEAPYGTHFKVESFAVQDYLVETNRTQPPLRLPKFAYFSGVDGHEDKHGLSFAWAPNSKGALVIYESDRGCLALVWVDPVGRRVTEAGKAVESALRNLVSERFGDGEEKAQTAVYYNRVALLEPDLLTIDGCLTQPGEKPEEVLAYWFRMRFNIVTEAGGARFTVASGRVLQAEDLLSEPPAGRGETMDAQMEKAFAKVRGPLGPGDRETLKKEQALWLKQREAMANPQHRAGFTLHRLEELKIRGAEK